MESQIQQILKAHGISMLELAKRAQVPYVTAHDLLTGKTSAAKARYYTLHALAQALEMSTDEFVQACEFPAVEDFAALNPGEELAKDTFATFRDNLHHRLKAEGDEAFLIELLQSSDDGLTTLEQMYKMALGDYLCNKLQLPLSDKYSELRRKKLPEPFYVGDSALFIKNITPIREFAIHNIIEGDVYDAC